MTWPCLLWRKGAAGTAALPVATDYVALWSGLGFPDAFTKVNALRLENEQKKQNFA